ncbi:hypothetical protein Glove_87g71 [Diversispora epigaea]|uniref:Chitin-binding type-2 domain-containing protein n=1 Tax=Diversispora epigaea TaxID=1348612 RepID=A0A397JGJ3_9GLOM|nr:hypothetical protein Glove_87g71 [Diversispora epigaea]
MGEKDYKKPPFFIYKHSIDLKKLQKIFIRQLIITFFNMNKRSITLLSITKCLYLLCIIGFVTSQEITCPSKEEQLIPNPNNFSEFFQCENGKPLLKECPTPLHFSVALNRCEWPDIAGCAETPDKR